MTAIHQFRCDGCKKKADATYNGEHWLPPAAWVELWDTQTARLNGNHLCPACVPLSAKKPKPRKDRSR